MAKQLQNSCLQT